MELGGNFLRIGFLLVNIFAYWPHVLAQEGYLSLACGRNSSFTDSSTGIHWIPDDNYTSAGIAWSTGLSSPTNSHHDSLRYFPEGNKNCYTLDVTNGRRYVIQGTHAFLNHDGYSRPAEFDVAIEATIVYSVKIAMDEPQVFEVIVTAQRHNLSYCLLTREGFPVISSLEVRPLPESSYPDASHGLLVPVRRVDFGEMRDVRYPLDSLDRSTGCETKIDSWMFALTGSEFTSSPVSTRGTFMVYLFFAGHLDSSIGTGERSFDIIANGASIREYDILESHSQFSEYIVKLSVTGNLNLTVVIEATGTNRELSCLNAVEIYRFISTMGGTQESDETDHLIESNELSGKIPSKAAEGYSHNLRYSFLGRRLLDDSSNSTASSSTTSNSSKGSNNLLKIFLGIAVGVTGFVALLAIAAMCFCYRRRRARIPGLTPWTGSDISNGPNYVMKSPLQDPKHLEMQSTGPQELSLKEVQTVTEKFKSKIGEGGFGAVYYGTLPNGTAVAVKVRSLNSNQGTREFTTELELLRKIKHENLVPLVGFCTEYQQEILVYPYMSNGSLHDRLYDKSVGRKPLDWLTRLNIVLGAARGILFLHTGGDRCVIHRDVKSSNILLDDSMKAKLADFGLSKISPREDESLISTEVRGTAEYLDPEYYQTHQLTEMSDVYSFGMVLLETICGREPLNMNRPPHERSLLEWVRPYIRDANIQQIVDPEIQTYTPESLWRVVEIALQSVEPHASRRPTIAYIVREIEDALIYENNASQYMASIQSLDSLCIPPNLDMKDFSKKDPMSYPLSLPFEPSPVFSETMTVAPDPSTRPSKSISRFSSTASTKSSSIGGEAR